MTDNLKAYTIGFPLYAGFGSLDVLRPFQVFTFLGVSPALLSKDGHPVTSFEGVTVQAHKTFRAVPAVPHAASNSMDIAALAEAFNDFMG